MDLPPQHVIDNSGKNYKLINYLGFGVIDYVISLDYISLRSVTILQRFKLKTYRNRPWKAINSRVLHLICKNVHKT